MHLSHYTITLMEKRSSLAIKVLILISILVMLTTGLKIAVTSRNSFGADFSIYWQAGRALALNHTSPYAESTTGTIQMGIYGHFAYADQDQLRYAYPPFSLLPVLPAVEMNSAWAQAYWMALNILLVFCAFLLFSKRQPIWFLSSLLFFYPVSRGIILGQFALMLGAISIITYKLIQVEGKQQRIFHIIAGILLAWCCMKPHLVAPVLLFFFLTAIRNRQIRVIYGFISGLVIFAVISFIMVPTWISDWLNLINNYLRYMPYRPVIAEWLSFINIDWSVFNTKLVYACVAALVSIFMIIAWWRTKIHDYLLMGWLILVFQLVNPNANSLLSDQIMFLLPISIWLSDPVVPAWIKKVGWLFFVGVPWLLFFTHVTTWEPYIVSSGLAGLYCIWLLGIWIKHWFDRSKSDRQNSAAISEVLSP